MDAWKYMRVHAYTYAHKHTHMRMHLYAYKYVSICMLASICMKVLSLELIR